MTQPVGDEGSTPVRSVQLKTATGAGPAIGSGRNPALADPRRYVRLAAALRQLILDGALTTGDPVPPIADLAAEHGCSRETAGKTLRLLEREGHVYRVPGLGYFTG
jgi:DNA-binding GntR family transcriptional regulator